MSNSTNICNINNVTNITEYNNNVLEAMTESYQGLSELVFMLLKNNFDSRTMNMYYIGHFVMFFVILIGLISIYYKLDTVTEIQDNNQKYRVYSIESPIGTGKSTFLRRLKKYLPNAIIIPEPIEEWKNFNGTNMLDIFYTDQKRYGYTFQTYTLLSRFNAFERAIQENPHAKTIIMERSWFSDLHCFAKMLHENGTICDFEKNLHEHWYRCLERKLPEISGHIYLKANLETTMNRLKKRNRNEESGVTEEYQSALINKHNEWLDNEIDIPVLTLDVNDDFEEDDNNFIDHFKRLIKFIEV